MVTRKGRKTLKFKVGKGGISLPLPTYGVLSFPSLFSPFFQAYYPSREGPDIGVLRS